MYIGIVANYLPPNSYSYGWNPEGYFQENSTVWYDLLDCDLLFGGGDLNARKKNYLDLIPDIDGNLPLRTNPDSVKKTW